MSRLRIATGFVPALLALLALAALSPAPLPAQPWTKIYSGPDQEGARMILPVTSGGYLLMGETSPPLSNAVVPWMRRVDGGGEVLWEKAYGVSWGMPWDAVETDDGGFVILADVLALTPVDHDEVWVFRIDSSGDLVWSRSFGGAVPENEHGVALVETATGGFLVAAEEESFGGDWQDVWLLELDSAGLLVRQGIYGTPGDVTDEVMAIIPTGDGGYLVAGMTYLDGIRRTGWLMKLDSTLGLEWARTHGSLTTGVEMGDVAEVAGGYLAACVAPSQDGGSELAFLLFDLDASGGILSQSAYDSPGRFERIWQIEPSAGGGTYILGGYGIMGNRPMLVKIDAGGALSWAREIADDGSSTIRSIATISGAGGGVIGAGSTRDFDAQRNDTWVLGLDADGLPDPNCDFVLDTALQTSVSNYGSAVWSPSVNTPVAETHDVAVAVRDIQTVARNPCAAPPPGEVSAVGLGMRPLRVQDRGDTVSVEEEPQATVYNLYSDALGVWYESSMGVASRCAMDTWADNGDGTLTLGFPVPAGHWVLVTASNAEGEGPAGPASDGTERMDLGTWVLCGAAP